MEEKSKADVSLESGELEPSPEKPLDIPLPIESPTSQSGYSTSPSVRNTSLRTSVLGIDNAKRRLKGFFIAKKAQEAKTTDVNTSVIPVSQKSSLFRKHKGNEEAESPSEKKKLKKVLSPHEKAKATITEIEELKKNEALRQAMFLTQSHLMKYGYKRRSSRDRRGGTYKYRTRRYRSNSQRSPDNYNHRRETRKNDSKSHSKSRHDYHNRSTNRNERDSKNRSDNKNDKTNSRKRSHEKTRSDSREAGRKYRNRDKKETSHQSRTRGSAEKNKFRNRLSNERSAKIPKHVHNDLSHFTLGEDKIIPECSGIEYSNDFETDENYSNNTPKSQGLVPENFLNYQTQQPLNSEGLLNRPTSTPNAKINAICPYDTESDSEDSAALLDNIVVADNILDRVQKQIDFAVTNMDVRPAFSGDSMSFATMTPKAYSAECISEQEIRRDFVRGSVKRKQKIYYQKNPYKNFIRHSYILQKSTKTQPSLIYSENPTYSLASRSWYPYQSDCLIKPDVADVTPSLSTNTKFNLLRKPYCAPIDMGDYDNTKNDISNRELVMNAEPPTIMIVKTHSNSLNTEYEEFMRAVATGSHHEYSKENKDKELDTKPFKLDLVEKYPETMLKSTTDNYQTSNQTSKIKLYPEQGKSPKSGNSKSTKSSSSQSSSDTNSSSSETSSSDSSSSNSSSSDSSSESDSDTSSSITDSLEKEELQDNNKTSELIVAVEPQDVDKSSKKLKKSYCEPTIPIPMPMPMIVKQEKETTFETYKSFPGPIISQIHIKQEPLDASNLKDFEITSELCKQDSETNQNSSACVKYDVAHAKSSTLNYGGETFHVVDWEESSESGKSDNGSRSKIHKNTYDSQSFINSPKQTSCKMINGNMPRNVANISDIPLPQISDLPNDTNLLNDSVTKHFLASAETTIPKKNNQFISFKLSSGSKCKPVSLTEGIYDKTLSNACKQIFVELEGENSSNSIKEILNDDLNVHQDPVNPESLRCRSRSHNDDQHLSIPRLDQRSSEKSSRRSKSRSPRNQKSHSSSSRSYNDRNKYKRHDSRKWSPRSHKYGNSKTSYDSGRNSHLSERSFAHGDRNHRRTITPDHLKYRNDGCTRNSEHSSYRSSSNYRPSSRNDTNERGCDDRRKRNSRRSRDRSRDRSTNSSRRDHDNRVYHRHEVNRDYHIVDHKLQSDSLFKDRSKAMPYSPKSLDLDNIPLPNQNDFSDMGTTSAITTVISTLKDYSTCDIEVLHPQENNCMIQSNHDTVQNDHCPIASLAPDNQCRMQDNSFASSYYNEPTSNIYKERPLQFSPKRISLDARINMVLGIDDANNSNSCEQEFNLNDYERAGYGNNYVDANQYSIPLVNEIAYPRNDSTEVIETIHTYPQTGPMTSKRRVQCANLVSVVLTDTPVQKTESKPAPIATRTSPNALLPFDILKSVPIVKLGGPLNALPPDVVKLESRTIFTQIEHYMKDERHQQRFQKQDLSKTTNTNEISSTRNQVHDEDNSNQENLFANVNCINKTSEREYIQNSRLAGKSILSTRFSTAKPSKASRNSSRQVKFADGILPGDGTSTSGGEMSSPTLNDNGKFKVKGKGIIPKRKKKKIKFRRNGEEQSFRDGYIELPPPPPPEDEPPNFLLQPYDIANNAALGYTEVPKALERFSVFFNSALSQRSHQVSDDSDDSSSE